MSPVASLRSACAKALYYWAWQGPAASIGRLALKSVGKRTASFEAIECHSVESYKIASAQLSEIIGPSYEDNDVARASIEHPPIFAHLLENLLINSRSSIMARANTLLGPRYRIANRHRIPSNAAVLGYYDQEVALRRSGPAAIVQNGIFVGGDSSNNWYHFLIECLPRVFATKFLPEKFDNYPLIVPPQVGSIPSFARALSAVASDREVVVAPAERTLVRQAVIIDPISVTPHNCYPGIWPEVTDFSQHEGMMRDFISFIRESVLGNDLPIKSQRRIFIVRPGDRRQYNEESLSEIAVQYNFEMIAPETLSLEAQARLWAEASYVVGPTGAAWSNMIFAARPLRGLIWMLPQYRGFASFSMLAGLLGHDLNYIDVDPESVPRSTSEAYGTAYSVSPEKFEIALKRLLEE